MHVIVDADYFELFKEDGQPKKETGEYSPFAEKVVPVVSLDEIKKLLSSPKDKRREVLLDMSNRI